MNFESYIGTKMIGAKSMTKGAYNEYRGWKISQNENPYENGYLVRYADGYESWSPKQPFEKSYRKTGEMTFGHALEMLKLGYKVARKGWNGKKMFLFLTKGEDLTSCICTEDMPPCIDSICMKTAQNTICVGWLASQADMLAEDWEIFE